MDDLDALAALVGGIGGAAAGRIEERLVAPYERHLTWVASVPAFLAGAALAALGARRVGIAVAGVGVGIVVNDALAFLSQQGMPWERRDMVFTGTTAHRTLPPWATGRTAEEAMVEDIRAAVWRGKNDIAVRRLAVEIIRGEGLDGRDYRGVATAIQRWVQGNITYVHDPVKTEIFQEARKTLLDVRAGDCDDQAIATASLLMSVGIPAHLVLLSREPNFSPRTSRYQHILTAAVIDGKEYWVETILPEATLDMRPWHNGRMTFNLATPSDSSKTVTVVHDPNAPTTPTDDGV